MMESAVDFFVVGVARGGTTSLYNYLQQHPDIFLPLVKECNYFSNVASLDKEVYLNPEEGKEYHMKIIESPKVYERLFFNAQAGQMKGEVSPSYLWDKTTAQRIYEYNKDAKIIVSLRNPIERAYSHYVMHFHTGYDKATTFEESLETERNLIWGGGNMYLEMSMYYNQVKAYFDLFGNDQIKVMIQEDWTKESQSTMNAVCDFLQLPEMEGNWNKETFNASKELKNKGLLDALRSEKIKKTLSKVFSEKTREKIKEQFFYKEGPKQSINPETYARLKEYFRDDVKQTGALIGQDLTTKWNLG